LLLFFKKEDLPSAYIFGAIRLGGAQVVPKNTVLLHLPPSSPELVVVGCGAAHPAR